MRKMLQWEPDKRASANELAEEDWIRMNLWYFRLWPTKRTWLSYKLDRCYQIIRRPSSNINRPQQPHSHYRCHSQLSSRKMPSTLKLYVNSSQVAYPPRNRGRAWCTGEPFVTQNWLEHLWAEQLIESRHPAMIDRSPRRQLDLSRRHVQLL